MAKTIVGLNDPKAVKKFSGQLAVDIARTSYFNKKFMGEGETASAPIQVLRHLENDAGEQITYDLSLQLKMQPVEGDDVLEGQEEDLKFYTDNVFIDQMRQGVNAGGRMTRKRTLHDLRMVAKKRQADWWSRVFDELLFIYLSGARGVNADYTFPTSYTGFAGNAVEAPDANHILYAGAATSKASLASTDKLTLATIDRLTAKATMMGGGTEGIPSIQPIVIDGEEHFVLVMSPWQKYDLKRDSGTGGWLDLQKAAAASEGNKSPIFKGGLGMYNNVVLHEAKPVIRFTDYGAGSNVAAARALFLGSQAAVVAFGSAGTGMRFDWTEETRDNGNQLVVATNSIFGVKKCRFNSTDFGVIAVDSAAANPG